MKKKFYLLCCLPLFMSCQNEEIDVKKNSDTNDLTGIELVYVPSESSVDIDVRSSASNKKYALKFDTEAIFSNTLEILNNMNDSERLAFAKKYGLISLQEIAKEADIELEIIGKEATNESDFKDKYEKYINKYKGILISNPYDNTDLSLYVPDCDNIFTYLTGESGIIIVGNTVKKDLYSNKIGESDRFAFNVMVQSRATSNLSEGFQKKDGSKKTICNVSLDPNTLFVNVHIGLQKKMWYGWKRDDNRDIYYHIELSNFVYNFWGRYGNQINIGCPNFYVFNGTGKVDYKTGYMLANTTNLSGIIRVWTDRMVGTTKVEYKGVVVDSEYKTITLPQLINNNAYSLNINLIR